MLRYTTFNNIQALSNCQGVGGVETASLTPLHLPDAVHFGLRALLFPILTRLRSQRASDYRRRGQATAVLFRWFLSSFNASE